MKKLLFLLLITTSCFSQKFNPTNNDSYWSYNSVLVKAKSSWLIDASNNNFQLTRNGDTKLRLLSPLTVNGSVLFDGVDDNVVAPDNNAYNLPGDYTIECWVRPTLITGAGFNTIATKGWGSFVGAFAYIIGSDGVLRYYSSSNGSTWDIASTLSSGSPPVNVWSHVAVSRQSGVIRTWFNGLQQATVTNGTTAMDNVTNFFIGTDVDSANDFAGYMCNFRISNNARYTANFTPSTSRFVNDANTILLTLQEPTSINNNEILDGSSNDFIVTRNGNVSNGSVGPANGINSGSFDGTGDGLTGTNAAYNMATFTYEVWIKQLNTSSASYGNSIFGLGNNSGYYQFLPRDNTISINGTGSSSPVYTQTLDNNWHHMAWVCNAGTNKIFYDGVQIGTWTQAYGAVAVTNQLHIGSNINLGTNGLFGNMALFRLSNNARYTANFTPTTTYESDANTVLFLPFKNAGIIDGIGKNNIETINVTTSTVVTKFGQPTMLFNGTNASISIPNSTALNLGSSDFTIDGWIYPTSVTGAKGVICKNWGNSIFGWVIFQSGTSLLLYVSSNNISWDIASGVNIGTIAINTSYYVMVRRIGNNWTTFLNGVQGATFVSSASIFTDTNPVVIGSTTDFINFFSGYVFDVRIKKGIGLPNYVPIAPLNYNN